MVGWACGKARWADVRVGGVHRGHSRRRLFIGGWRRTPRASKPVDRQNRKCWLDIGGANDSPSSSLHGDTFEQWEGVGRGRTEPSLSESEHGRAVRPSFRQVVLGAKYELRAHRADCDLAQQRGRARRWRSLDSASRALQSPQRSMAFWRDDVVSPHRRLCDPASRRQRTRVWRRRNIERSACGGDL